MSHRWRGLKAPLAAFAVSALVVLTPGVASSEEQPPNPLTELERALQPEQESGQDAPPAQDEVAAESAQPAAGDGASANVAAPSRQALAPSSDDDTGNNETQNPRPPDHGSAENADVDFGPAEDRQDAADVGHNDATVQDDDSTTADSTLLAIGGNEIAGAHADSEGQERESFEPLAPITDELCAGSEGQVCLEVLYADASATDNGRTSTSESRSGVANVCVRQDAGTGPCAVAAKAASSEGEAQRNQRSGRTTASSESDLAHVCLERDPVTGHCALGASAVHSEGDADSGGPQAGAHRDSYVGALDLGGEEQGRIGDPTAIEELATACPTGPGLLCAYLNQGETYVGKSIAGHAQDALKATILPGLPIQIDLGLGHTETLVHNDGGEAAPGDAEDNGDGPVVAGVGSGGPGNPGAGGGGGEVLGAAAGVLPNTGGLWSGLLAIALLTIGAGAFFVAFSRRQVVG